ncbi:hypothetical protein BPAE_0025g00630 [Botrytis paeoniae]|uniref:Uncharacterized protein n=1 Tax=Botrytis paeoniae TaxID=278948 RepID=A0A4Z1FV13_9HELO|nr:hypothetical protein BPAE_0025g00630 [Botrytis paeoniae]
MYPSRGDGKNDARRMPSNATSNELDMKKYATDICKIPLHEAGFLFNSNQGSEREFYNKIMKFRVGPSVESLQAVKPLKIEDPKEIVDMRDLYIANTAKYAACFRGVRPFEGFGLPGDGLITKSKRNSTTYHHANTSSNGIDIIKLFKSVHEIARLHFDDIMEKKFSFEDALAHPKLQNLFQSTHFDIASHIMLRKNLDEPDPTWARATAEPDILRQFNELRRDGVKDLTSFIDRHFKTVKYGNVRRIYFATKSWVFKVLYEPENLMRSISELRNFEMSGVVTHELKDSSDKILHNTQKHDNLKNSSLKAEYKKLGKKWSIEEGGRYMLFYVRISLKIKPLPNDYFDNDAPEFEPRYFWDTSDIDMTNANQQNRSTLKKTSTSTSQSSSNKGQIGFRSEPPKFGPSTNSRVPMFGPRLDSESPQLGSSSKAPNLGSTLQGPKQGSSTQASGYRPSSQESAIDARNLPKTPSTPSSGHPYSSRIPKKRDQDELMYDDSDNGGNNDSYHSADSGARSSSRPRNEEYCDFCRKSGHDERDCHKKNPALPPSRGTLSRRGRGSLSRGFGSANEGVGSSTDQNRRDQGPGSGEYGSNHGDRGPYLGGYGSNRNSNPGWGSGGGRRGSL